MDELSCDEIKAVSTGARLLQLAKDNRLEAMIVTILLYSTGVFEKAVVYGAGMC